MSTNKYTSCLPGGFAQPSTLSGLPDSASILVAFSGGADSTALLHILSEYSNQSGAIIYAAHVNHCIRGDEADRDERFCLEFANSLGVKIFVLRADVPAIARESKESLETAARRVRYEFFDQIMKENNIEILATAHNANDNLETLIFNLARGTGLSGMCGIPQSRKTAYGTVIRPMLAMEKSDILEYCANNSLDFVTDSTNTDTDYTRNLIRAKIIPVMQQINTAALKNATRTSQNLHEDSIYIDSIANQFIEELEIPYTIDLKEVCSTPLPVINRVLIRLYDELSGGATLTRVHLKALHDLCLQAIPHSAVSLPQEIEGVIEDQKLCLRKKAESQSIEDYVIQLFEGKNSISQANTEIFIGNSQNAKNVYKIETLLYIDFDKIKGELFARPRRAGDRIKLCGMSKSLKKLFCDKKISLELRDRIPIICDSQKIVAVPFIGICDGCKDNTKKEKNAVRFYLY